MKKQSALLALALSLTAALQISVAGRNGGYIGQAPTNTVGQPISGGFHFGQLERGTSSVQLTPTPTPTPTPTATATATPTPTNTPTPTPTNTPTPTPTPDEMTNAQKLGLSPSTAVGKLVNVIDAIRVTGSGESAAAGWYLWTPELDGFDGIYTVFRNPVSGWEIRWAAFASDPNGGGALTTQWGIKRPDGTFAYWGDSGDDGGGDPTAVGWNTSGPVDRPPFAEPPVPTVATETYMQKLIAPSSALTAVFVHDVGVFTERGTSHGKSYYDLIGTPDDTATSAVVYTGSAWVRFDDGGSIADTASDSPSKPWAATWGTDIDESVTQGQINAGIIVTGAATTNANDTYPAAGNSNGKNAYIGIIHGLTLQWQPLLGGGPPEWQINNNDPTSTTDSSIPSGATFNNSATVTRDDVAAEANWIPGP